MNIYGDTGNITALQKRAQWRGIEVKVKLISLKTTLKPGSVDIFFFGGGQDQSQELIAKDLEVKGPIIRDAVEQGVPLLSICGGYQLLGQYYQPHTGSKLPGIGLFPAYTEASFDRMIGNIVVKSADFGTLVGFENHSGKTYFQEGAIPLGRIIKGFGNNGENHSEGCIYKNAIGCYMHGSLLPKNPQLTDWLLQKALEVKYKEPIKLKNLDDDLENKAHRTALLKFG